VTNPTPELASFDLEKIREQVASEAPRVAELGQWPEWMKANAAKSLSSRIPEAGKMAPGFDAGTACALDLIPRDKQALSAALHASYTPEKIAQVRKEMEHLDPDSETAWWLAASHVCQEEKGVDKDRFLGQLKTFESLAREPKERLAAAIRCYTETMTHFETQTHGVPFGKIDGCMQAAYLAGYPFGTMYSDKYNIYFIGTPFDSLGLEDFPWKDPDSKDHRGNSGPVFGSKQFVKCADEEEFKRALEVVKKKLPMPETSKKFDSFNDIPKDPKQEGLRPRHRYAGGSPDEKIEVAGKLYKKKPAFIVRSQSWNKEKVPKDRPYTEKEFFSNETQGVGPGPGWTEFRYYLFENWGIRDHDLRRLSDLPLYVLIPNEEPDEEDEEET